MKPSPRLIPTVLLLCTACATNTNAPLTPDQFTREYADALRSASPGLNVRIVRDLELKLIPADGGEISAFLDNAYDNYKQNPQKKSETIATFVAANIASIQTTQHEIDRTRIVPVVKDHEWLAEARKVLLDRGATEVPENISEELCPGLVIVYAEDSPMNIRYLVQEHLKDAKLEKKDLRELACANLRRLLPKVECHGSDGVYMLTAGGDYEASLLLLESFGCEKPVEVKGDPVVAIPTRDVLLVTGSRDPEGINKVSGLARKIHGEGSYRLTLKLFLYRDGAFSEFTPGTQP